VSKPPSLNMTLLRTYTRLQFRSARFYAVLFFYLFIVLLAPLLVVTKLAPNPGSAGALLTPQQDFIVLLATISGAVLAGDSISQDFSRQGLFTLTQPIERARLVAVRYGAAAIAGTTITLIFFAIGAAETYGFYGTVISNYGEITAVALLYTLAMLAFVMLMSAVFYKSQVVPILISIMSILVFMPVVSGIMGTKGREPWPLLTYADEVISALYTSPYPSHVQSLGKINAYFPTPIEAVAIMAGYVVVSLLLCSLLYRRRELREV
jgi:ABC-2 type transport system permease protein